MSSRRRRRLRLLRRALRHPDVAVASLQYHSRRLITRPVRTALILFGVYLALVAIATVASDPVVAQLVIEGESPPVELLGSVPSPTFLVAAGFATAVGAPIAIVARGLRRDLRTNRSRRRRLEE